MKVGICHLPEQPARSLELARCAEAAGIDVFGIADSPQLFGATYPTVQHVLAGTQRIAVGPVVTNPVTRHESVHAADLAMLATMFPGRVVAAFGAGDSAVHSVGLRPAAPQRVGEAVATVAQRTGDAVSLYVAVGGLATARAVPPGAHGVILGGGLDASWLAQLGDEAEAAAGHRLQRWGFATGWLLDDDSFVDMARTTVRASVVGISRHALGSEAARATIPAALREGVEAVRAAYRVEGHARSAGPNAELLQRHPEVEAYLMERFALVGTADSVAPRLRDVAARARLDGVLLGSSIPDAAQHITTVGTRLRPLLLDPVEPSVAPSDAAHSIGGLHAHGER